MPVKALKRKRSVSQSKRRAQAIEKMVEDRAEEILYKHNLFDIKILIALIVIGIASFVVTSLAASLPSYGTGSTVLSATTTSTPRLDVSSKQDWGTLPRIIVPTSSQNEILGKWTVTAENEPVSLTKVSFVALNTNYSARTDATEFGSVGLYDESGYNLLSQGTVSGGEFSFNLNNFVVTPKDPEVFVVKSSITESGVMKPDSIIRLGVRASLNGAWEGVGTISGKKLSGSDFNFSDLAYGYGALTSFNLYHDSKLYVYKNDDGTKLVSQSLSTSTRTYAFDLLGKGSQPIRISKVVVKMNMVSTTPYKISPTSTPGYITGLKLYEVDSNQKLLNLVATSTFCLINPRTTVVPVGAQQIIPGVGKCYVGTGSVVFDIKNDLILSKYEDDYYTSHFGPILQGKKFVVIADTSAVSKTPTWQGDLANLQITSQITGSTGPKITTNPKQTYWQSGGVFYHYTPVGGVENTRPYYASDSFPVAANTVWLKYWQK